MVVIRLARGGAKKRPFFNMVVADSRRARDGRFIERIGFYNPKAPEGPERLRIDRERLTHWQSKGAMLVRYRGAARQAVWRAATASLQPEKLVVMGRIVAPFGVKGWVKVQPLTRAAAKNLLAYPTWWVGRRRRVAGARRSREARVQGRTVVAQLEGCDDREAAAALRGQAGGGAARAVARSAQQNEYYWADLIGLKVVNEAGRGSRAGGPDPARPARTTCWSCRASGSG